MTLRFVECLTKLAFSARRGHHICRPSLPLLLSNKVLDKNIQIRHILTDTQIQQQKLGWFESVSQKIKQFFRKYKLRRSGILLYECVADRLDYNSFTKELHMADTFSTWFLVTELHVWMLMASLMQSPNTGRYLRNCMVQAMWNDVTLRTRKLGEVNISVVKSQVGILSEEFQAALLNYDEGLLTSDTVLAGAVWRRLLQRDPSYTARDVEAMVFYIRRTMASLDKIHVNELVLRQNIQWIPLNIIREELPK